MVYRPNSEHARMVDDFLRDLERMSPGQNRIEAVNVDTREGIAIATLYDVMQYPKVMVTSDDGRVVRDWDAGSMPLLSDVSYYANQSSGSYSMSLHTV